MERRMRDLDIATHNDGSYRVVSINHYPKEDALNLPAYRYGHVIVVRWEDRDGKLAESFDGWAATAEDARAEAQRKLEAWDAKMRAISAWSFKREAVS